MLFFRFMPFAAIFAASLWFCAASALAAPDTNPAPATGLFSINPDVYYLAAAKSNGLWGYINLQGDWVIPPQFTDAEPFAVNGLARVKVGGDDQWRLWVEDGVEDDGKWGYIDLDGEWVIPPQFYRVENFAANGLAWARAAYDNWGIINLAGEWVVPPQSGKIASAYPFDSNGLSSAVTPGPDRKWGFIDISGEWAIEPQFDEVAHYFAANGFIRVMVSQTLSSSNFGGFAHDNFDSRYGFVNADGQLIPPQFEELNTSAFKFRDSLIAAKERRGYWGFVDANGEWVIQPQFWGLTGFRGMDLAAAAQNPGEWGFIDTNGEWVIQPQFNAVGHFAHCNLASVRIDGKWGFVDLEGELVIPPQLDYAYDFASNGLAMVNSDDKWGFLDVSGQWAIPPQFENVGAFSENGLAKAQEAGGAGKWGFINMSGEWVIEPRFASSPGSFGANGLLGIMVEGNSYGYLDVTGEWVIPPTEFEKVGSFAYIKP